VKSDEVRTPILRLEKLEPIEKMRN